jgi:hypothetical protein
MYSKKNFKKIFNLKKPYVQFSNWDYVFIPYSKKELFDEWKTLVNIRPITLFDYYESNLGKVSGLSKSEASKLGIKSGRTSARALMRIMQRLPYYWTKNDWEWAKRQIAFIKRMRGNKGKLFDKHGRPTRKLMSLMIWGHFPYDQFKKELK